MIDRFSAGEQGLGYLYQPRFALLQMLQLPEEVSVFVEKDDDLEFIDVGGRKTLGSFKHKTPGERLTDLSIDFWKSVRIWLTRYKDGGRFESTHRFYLFTTNEVSETSFLKEFLPTAIARPADDPTLLTLADGALAETQSEPIQKIAKELHTLNETEQIDFWRRITIFDRAPRIDDILALIKDRSMRSIRREYRDFVFERLEGWWHDIVLALLTGKRSLPIYGYEVSDKLTAFADEYKADNLPITFRGKMPDGEVDTDNDDRLFVRQLREIGISSARIRNAILDYYRAFEQRSAWAREHLLVSGELEDYEDRGGFSEFDCGLALGRARDDADLIRSVLLDGRCHLAQPVHYLFFDLLDHLAVAEVHLADVHRTHLVSPLVRLWRNLGAHRLAHRVAVLQ